MYDELLKNHLTLVLYVGFSLLVALYAYKSNKGTFLGYFIGSLIFSPVAAGVYALLTD